MGNDRFVKLSGDDDRELVPVIQDRIDAVKHCVKKYNEECQRLGLFKAFSIDELHSDGLDGRQRANLQANIDRLSDDVVEVTDGPPKDSSSSIKRADKTDPNR